MTSPAQLPLWAETFGWLAVQAALVVIVACLAQLFLRSAATRRSLWRAVLATLALLLAAEFTGVTGQTAERVRTAW